MVERVGTQPVGTQPVGTQPVGTQPVETQPVGIRTLLVANRGEIALRVMRTARRMGIRTVAICTDLDASAPHVRAADAAVAVPSYLDIDAVVDAARSSGATAIHPGYGFLSERPELARAVEAAGLTLVGPSSEVMEQMGRKDAARKIAVAAGVPVVPSYELDAPDQMAFPVLVKAAAGGGGKGMRVVRRAEDYADAVAAARRESLTAFGDDTLLVEKYVESGRHIEVQVLADGHGNVVHLYERDCSTQRRHQKVLEEAPAPTITEETRRLVTSSAVAMAAEVGYENAGTVEFLLDNASIREASIREGSIREGSTGDGTGEPAFYFLEMNTRLQVEHPVTELTVEVGGRPLDLVELQLRVAAGEPLAFGQDDVRQHGHAIEARVYAEDPFAGFLPQAGTARIVRWPDPDVPGTRVDHALESGQVVSTSYDPMLGKVIAHGPDREAARRALVAALDRTAILGFATNTGFLRMLAASDEFRDATIDTAWLDTAWSDRAEIPEHGVDVARIIAAWTDVAVRATIAGPPHPFAADGWRLGAPPAPELVALDEVLAVRRAEGTVRDAVGDHRVHELLAERHTVVLDIDGSRHWAVVDATEHQVEVVHQGQRHVFERPDVFGDHGPTAGDGTLLAPMPGTLLSVDVAVGDHVVEGQRLGVLEAMKMELSLTAPFEGTVTAVGAGTGDQVQLKQLLFEVEATDD